jgi:hypothetical protein
MSHFYGTLQGNRGEATRCGSAGSGVRTYAAGWRGAICATIYQETIDGEDVDMFRVSLVPWHGSGGMSQVLATGRLNANEQAEMFSRTSDYPYWKQKKLERMK